MSNKNIQDVDINTLTPDEQKEHSVNYKNVGDTDKFLKNIDTTKRNSLIPEPPKTGEIMTCKVCGKEMLPKDFSTNQIVRRREFKWQMHDACMSQMTDLVDRSTPGLMAERKSAK